MTQFSLFGAAALDPAIVDLDGVVLAGGLWSRRGDRARLSIVVDAPWRANALAAEFLVRDVAEDADAVVPAADGLSVRSAFSAALAVQASRWMRGAREGRPADLDLTAGGLRLWAIAAGRWDDPGFLFAVREDMHPFAGAQLARLGVAAVALTRRGRPGWRVTGTRRLRRLGELLGPAPEGATHEWPRPNA